ncbi:heat-inducible transcriptional repressor HrcA [Haliovirga abyssi]|uniref:Heat-inducible transcription repressor HrcA n=1 Tax=Haliovirga abyssi TaxID=2996794 RepID=A0AAU9DJM0_9FUSO|nr:heat-inducible transcriptional repressor HrcA [Haliovirga abyssi]BDU50067.1 heat-inducible transcription repressor HrcA [Haliovirga abyssi]
MNDREKTILGAVIDYYITNGESVGSRTITKKYDISLSSATIRNVMADLEEAGYIEKTHTSSGRVPTNKGYKFYLETLLKIKKLSEDEITKINIAYEKRVGELEEVLEKTSMLLSKMTNYASLAIELNYKAEKLKKLELIYVNSYTIMAVIILENDSVRTKRINLDYRIDEEELKDISKILNNKFKGSKLGEILPKLEKIINKRRDDAFEGVVKECFGEIEGSFYLEGATNMINVLENENSKEVANVVKFLDDKKDIRKFFEDMVKKRNYEDGKVNVILGEELGIEGLKDLSFIFSVYTLDDAKGIVGIIGPKRMEYSKNLGLVEYVTKEVNIAMNKIKNRRE